MGSSYGHTADSIANEVADLGFQEQPIDSQWSTYFYYLGGHRIEFNGPSMESFREMELETKKFEGMYALDVYRSDCLIPQLREISKYLGKGEES